MHIGASTNTLEHRMSGVVLDFGLYWALTFIEPFGPETGLIEPKGLSLTKRLFRVSSAGSPADPFPPVVDNRKEESHNEQLMTLRARSHGRRLRPVRRWWYSRSRISNFQKRNNAISLTFTCLISTSEAPPLVAFQVARRTFSLTCLSSEPIDWSWNNSYCTTRKAMMGHGAS